MMARSLIFPLFAPTVFAAAPTFENNIQPILAAHCTTCHGGDSPKAKLDLTSVEGALKGGKSGPAVKPGSLKESLIWLFVSTDKMPAKGEKLNDAERDVLRAWIVGGGASSKGSVTTPTVKSGVASTAKAIDAAIDAKLAHEKVAPAGPADDAEFLRRAFLDIAGIIPTAERAAAFLDSKDPAKQAKLIDELLELPEYARAAGGLWAGLITTEEPTLKPKFEPWLTEQFHKNRPWDAVVRDLIVAEGMGPETTFVVANGENKKPVPEKLAGATARLFLGMQLQCAECHNHPFTEWKQTDFWAIAAFYSRTVSAGKAPAGIRELETGAKLSPPKGQKNAPPISGAVIAISPTAGNAAGKPVRAKFLQGATPDLDDKGPYRPALAEWVTSASNPYFAEAAVNRLWAQFFGRGLVNPVDDLSSENAPSHPGALRALADEFRAAGFDRKHAIRCITATNAYRRTSAGKPSAADLYDRMPVKVITPEALYDSLLRATGAKELSLASYVPTAGRGGVKGKVEPRTSSLRFFGTRDPYADGTDYTHGIPQALGLLNGAILSQPTPFVLQLTKEKLPPEQAVERLFLAALSRRPAPDEAKTMVAFAARKPEAADGYAAVLWVLLNSPEFVLTR